MSYKEYYKDQLSRLSNDKYFKAVKFSSSLDDTNYLDLTSESIPIIINFLKKEQKRLKKEAKNAVAAAKEFSK